MVAGAVELAQTDDQIAVDDATADVAAGDVVLDRLRALVDVDRVRSGQDVAERQLDVGLALLDQHGGRGAEDLAGRLLRDVGEGSDDVAEVVAGSGVDMRRVRGVLRFLSPRQRGAHRDRAPSPRHRDSPRVVQRRARAMDVNLLAEPGASPLPSVPIRRDEVDRSRLLVRSRFYQLIAIVLSDQMLVPFRLRRDSEAPLPALGVGERAGG